MLFSTFILSVLTFLLSPPASKLAYCLSNRTASVVPTPTPGWYCVLEGRVDSEAC